ncbi:DUF3352 domain-containing protein [Tumidithrix elongata RA019]|uniref:DUF3352 domain-containing protein n=1 Tax=Tumidithrix elongata BACA0141 TaxID=2716417 RepID=A0AAW9PZY6_9CYAN|nr:DUF3352 domain-containing protein [Tumidithrix elongata RA019]
MSERKPNLLIPAIGAAVVAAGGAGAYFYFNKPVTNPGGTPTPVSGAVNLVPKQALMAITISTDGVALAQLDQFLPPEVKKQFDATLNQAKQSTLASSDFDFEKDIKPWAGNSVVIAILPKAKPSALLPSTTPRYVPVSDTGTIQLVQTPTPPATASTEIPNMLIVAEIKDKAGATQFTEKVKTKAGGKPSQSDYKGIQISKFGEGSKETSSAFVGDYLVVSPQVQTVQKAIDTFKGEASLSSALSADNLELKNPLIQLYIPDFANSVQQMAAMNPQTPPLTPESLEQIKQITAFNMGAGVDSEGIRVKMIAKIDPNFTKVEYKTSPGKVISQLPSQTFALVTGIDLNSSWKRFLEAAARVPDAKKAVDQWREQSKASPLAIDLDKDVFGWMDGEFALGAIASSEGILAQFGVGPVLILQTSNRSAAESLLKKFDDFVKTNGGSVTTKDVGGVSVTEWGGPGAPPFVSHGWHQKDSFFITAAPLVSTIAPKPASPLDADAVFKTVTASLLSPSSIGYFYLDMEKSWAVISKSMPESSKAEIPPVVMEAIGAVRGIGVTVSVPDKSTSKAELLLSLKPKPAAK